jgi:hypothetical protein
VPRRPTATACAGWLAATIVAACAQHTDLARLMHKHLPMARCRFAPAKIIRRAEHRKREAARSRPGRSNDPGRPRGGGGGRRCLSGPRNLATGPGTGDGGPPLPVVHDSRSGPARGEVLRLNAG